MIRAIFTVGVGSTVVFPLKYATYNPNKFFKLFLYNLPAPGGYAAFALYGWGTFALL